MHRSLVQDAADTTGIGVKARGRCGPKFKARRWQLAWVCSVVPRHQPRLSRWGLRRVLLQRRGVAHFGTLRGQLPTATAGKTELKLGVELA